MRVLVACVLLLPVAACSDDGGPQQASGSPSATASSASAVQYRSVELDDLDFRSFISPSRNIGCVIGPTGGSCDLREADWRAPRDPACSGDFNPTTAGFTKEGRAQVGECATDTVFDAQAEVLAYGEGIVTGDFRCASRREGISCENTKTGHGFLVSKAAYRLF